MGLFDRIFRRGRKRVTYPSDLRSQIDRVMADLRAQTAAHDGI
jgi:hypothetical protein